MEKKSLLIGVLFLLALPFAGCKNSTEPSDDNSVPGSGISKTSFALGVGNEWNYSGTGYNANNSVLSKSVGTGKLKVLSETNSNGLDGFKMYFDSKDYRGKFMGSNEFFISAENNALWTLEELVSGSTSPLKLLPFSTTSAVIRSDINNYQYAIYDTAYPYDFLHFENVQINIDIKFKYEGTEDVNGPAGNFNCRKILVTLDAAQKSEVNGTTIFDGKTWNAQTTWWLSDNNGLIKTQTVWYTIIDSVKHYFWNPNSGDLEIYYRDILGESLNLYHLRYIFNAGDYVIPMSDPWNEFKIRNSSSLKYLGKYITELTNKNF